MRRRWRVAGDMAVSGVVVLLSLPADDTPRHLALAVATALVLLGRRSRPVAVASVVVALTVIIVATGPATPVLAGSLAAVYTVASRRDPGTSLGTAGAVALVPAISAAGATGAVPDGLSVAGTAVGLVAGAWALGALVRSRQQTLTALQARADLVERDRDLTVALAVERERARIMRDMHDVVGHSLSVIAVQADAARAVLDREPAASATAMDRVGALARDALAEVRAVIHAARDDTLPDPVTGREATTGLAALVETARAAGTPVGLQIDGEVARLSAAESTMAYRIVQESLTNARRHAAPGTRADVRLVVTPTALDITIRSTDPSGGRREPDRAGTGIASMRERAAVLGGTLRAGWVSDTTFEVAASVPRHPRSVQP